MKRDIDVRVAGAARNLTGESPVWSVAEQCLYWADVHAGDVHRLDAEGVHRAWSVGPRIGAVGLRAKGGLIATLPDGVYALDLQGDTVGTMRIAAPDLADDVRLKEGKVDRLGRYWCASTGPDYTTRRGSLFRIDGPGRCSEVDRGFILPNGIAFGADGRTLAMADSPADVVFRYNLDERGNIAGERRRWFSTDGVPGFVDGATYDSEGGYWFAFAYDSAVGRLDADGRLDRLVRLPTRYPTMCAFGGPDLDILYVTSSSRHVTDAERAAEPLAGALFAIHGLGATGVPEPACAF